MIIITIYISKLLNRILNITIKQSAASQLRQQSLRAYWGHVISSWRLGVYYETWAHVLSQNMDILDGIVVDITKNALLYSNIRSETSEIESFNIVYSFP